MELGVKTIKLIALNGDFSGPVQVKFPGWDGSGIKISREDIKKIKDPKFLSIEETARKDFLKKLQGAGVYFLFCIDETDGVYIGQSDNVQQRLEQHDIEKEAWIRAVAFVGEGLNTATTKYLENKFVVKARDAKRCKVLTKSSSSESSLSYEEKSNMDEFAEHVEIIFSTLGSKLFKTNKGKEERNSNRYFMNYKDAKAEMLLTDEGFILLAGSKICATEVPSCRADTHVKREEYIEKRLIDKKTMIVKQDILFTSNSAAARFVAGATVSGNKCWKKSEK